MSAIASSQVTELDGHAWPPIAALNPQQQQAVLLPRQSALILAGAGSGKTKVLTTRMAWLLYSGQAQRHQILAVTFTNKASREMLTRLSAMLPVDMRSMWVGTFHGLCHRLLRLHHKEAGLPSSFQILDTQDQLSAIKRLYKSMNVDDKLYPVKALQYFIQQSKEDGLRSADCPVHDQRSRIFVELYQAYEQQCMREAVVDFGELLLRSYELLSKNDVLAKHYQERFRYLLVDEFQDTNHLQYAWLKLMAGAEGAVFAVGDDDQSIYAFRGAKVSNMAQFEREFQVQHRIVLEQNYRSTGYVLDAANTLIANNSARLGKNLWTDQGQGEPIKLYAALTDLDEAKWLAEEIQALTETSSTGEVRRSDVAILYRSNAQSRVIEQHLFAAGLPYRVYGGLRFFERMEIKHAMAYLRLIDSLADNTSFLRVVNVPARGIGARSIEQLTEVAARLGISLADAVPELTGKAGAMLSQFIHLIEQLKEQVATMLLPDAVGCVIAQSGLRRFFQEERDGADRLDNLDELINAAAAYCASEGVMDRLALSTQIDEEGGSPLSGFLSHAALEAGDHQAEQGQEAVQLMTVHAAKGLEFPVVFVTGLEEGLFPHENSFEGTVDAGNGQRVQAVEEERRLMYVAMTRARQRLYLSYAQQRMLHGQTRYHIRSRFLNELPEDGVKEIGGRLHNVQREGANGDWSGFQSSTQAQSSLPTGFQHGRAKPSSVARPFRVGQMVRHERFGEGLVVNYEGQGQDLRIQINFGRQGVKWLMVSLAKLIAA